MSDVDVDEHGRPEPPLAAGEVETLVGFLEYQRATFGWKVRGLDDEQLRTRLASSALSLGGMLVHLARVEDTWFAECVGEAQRSEPWASMPWAEEWGSAAGSTGEELRALWLGRVERSRQVVADAVAAGPGALGATHPAWGGEGHPSLRWVLVHMIEEYARHNGHCDLLREAIDGEVGE